MRDKANEAAIMKNIICLDFSHEPLHDGGAVNALLCFQSISCKINNLKY